MKLNYLTKDSFLTNSLKRQNTLVNFYSFIKITVLGWLLFNTAEVSAQWNSYQVYESIGASIPTSGGTWTDNSATYATGQAYSGNNQIEFDAVGDYIQTPLISTPGIFSFFYKKSGTGSGTPKFTIYTSPDGITWTPRTATGAFNVTPYKPYSINLGLLGLTNVYVRIIDESVSSTNIRYIDDIAWTSTVTSENAFIPLYHPAASHVNTKTIACGTTYTFTDQGGINDTYNTTKTFTITFTPSVPTNKVELTFNAFDLESGYDSMTFYDGPTTGSPQILSGLPVGANPPTCPADSFYGTTSPGTITSTDASGAITVVFKSNGTTNNSGWIAGVTCNPPTTCQKPTLTPTTAITASTATINWAAPSPAPSSGYEYVISTNNITPSGSGTFVAGLSANISSLAANTVYYVFVRSDCGSGAFSTWTPSGSFTTAFGPCIAPVAQANTYVAGAATSTTFSGSFSGSASGYLVVQSTSATPPTQPVNGTTYASGNITTLGAGLTFVQTAATTSFTASALAGNTAYYYYIFAYNDASCIGGPIYNTAGPLVGTGTTCPAVPNTVGTASVTSGGFTINWTAPTGGIAGALTYTVQVTTDAAYSTGWIAGSPFAVAAPTTTLAVSGLNSNTLYYYRILANNGCSSAYVTGSQLTLLPNCVAPVSQASAFILGTPTTSSLPASFSGTASGYLVVRSLTSAAPAQPSNGTTYTALNVASLGAAFTFVQSGASTTIAGTGLTAGTQYYYFIFAYNDTSCLGGPAYNALGALTGSGTTLNGFNDNCSTAIGLTVNPTMTCTTVTNGTTVLATQSQAGCVGTADDDVWYSFIATSNTHIITATPISLSDIVFQVFSGTCGGTLTSLACIDNTAGTNAETTTLSGLAIGTTYYVRIYSYSNGSNQGTFSVCIATQPPCTTTTVPYTENFDSVTPPNLALCISVQNANADANFWKTCTSTSLGNGTAIAPVSGLNQMGIQYTSNPMNDWFYLRGLNLTAGTAYRLTFYSRGYNFIGDNELLEVKYGTSATAASMTTTLFSTFTLVGNKPYTLKTIDFVPATTGVFYIGFHGVSPANSWYIFVDDVSVTLSPSCLTPTLTGSTNITSNSATINWTAPIVAPSSGYQYLYSTTFLNPIPSTAPSGSTAAGVTTMGLTGLTSGTIYYVWVRSNCGGSQSEWSAVTSFTTSAGPPVTTNAAICPGSSATITATGACTNLNNLGNTINGAWDAGTDPRAIRPYIFISNSTTCEFDTNGLTANYTSLDFQVSATGFYTFTMPDTTAYDAMGYIVINPFNPGSCASGTWIVGDDDSGATLYEPLMSATLNAGITYTLITTLFSGINIALTNTYQWNVTGPGTISGVVGGTIEWYTAASGGSSIGSGSPFNPVGVSGSGLTNTNTPGTYPYYAACSNNPSVRTLANFVVNGPTSVISGTGTTCSGSVPMSIALTGTSPWTFTYTDGTTPVTVTGNTTNPYVFNVSPTVPKTYTVTSLSDANCTATAAGRTGTGTITASKTWAGATPDWNTAGNWNPVGIPTSSDCVVIPNTAIDPIISATGNAYAYSLTVLNGGILQVNSGYNITVTDIVNVVTGGQFNISNSASLLQINNVTNSGAVTIERTTQPMYRYDYTYWGSPVTFASNFTLGTGVNSLSPLTLSDKYYSWIPTVSNAGGNWASESAATIMDPIKGYCVRAPQTFSPSVGTTMPYTTHFIGTPNNGIFTSPIYHGTLALALNDDKYNLLGNPYPSAIDAQLFLTDPLNTPIIDGTIYFWTHNSPISAANPNPFYGTFALNYDNNDYAAWNSLGAVGFRGIQAGTGGVTPNGFIATGQGFFTKSTGTAPTGASVTFKNSMRVSGNNNQFFRNSNASANQESRSENTLLEKNRIWLDLISDSGKFSQILVGYIADASLGWDRMYDGVPITESGMLLYSIIPERKLTIQGRPLPFEIEDQVPLGFKSTQQDIYTLGLDGVDGLFESQNIYIEDRDLNIIHDLKSSPYTFNAPAGTFDTRFVLRYLDYTLNTDVFNTNSTVIALIYQKNLVVEASQYIKEVMVYDITGKLINTYIPNNKSMKISESFMYAEGVYLLKVKLENDVIVAKKLIHKLNE